VRRRHDFGCRIPGALSVADGRIQASRDILIAKSFGFGQSVIPAKPEQVSKPLADADASAFANANPHSSQIHAGFTYSDPGSGSSGSAASASPGSAASASASRGHMWCAVKSVGLQLLRERHIHHQPAI
jgi:hypothetical protein